MCYSGPSSAGGEKVLPTLKVSAADGLGIVCSQARRNYAMKGQIETYLAEFIYDHCPSMQIPKCIMYEVCTEASRSSV